MTDFRHGVAGGMAGIAVDILFYPLETVKTRIMASSPDENLTRIARSKFRGFSCQMIVSFPYSFTFFYVYERVRTYLNPHNAGTNVVASIAAEITANVVRNPFEVIKQQIMVGRSESILSSLGQIYRSKGVRGFYTGYNSTLIRDIVFSAIQLPLFEYFRQRNMWGLEEVANAALSGSVAATVSAFVSCPFDVIKTRTMTQKMGESSLKAIPVIYRQSGLKGFFKGATFRCGILSFGGIIYFGALQKSRMLLGVN